MCSCAVCADEINLHRACPRSDFDKANTRGRLHTPGTNAHDSTHVLMGWGTVTKHGYSTAEETAAILNQANVIRSPRHNNKWDMSYSEKTYKYLKLYRDLTILSIALKKSIFKA